MTQRESLKTSWVYTLRKEELVSYLLQCAQDPSGTVDEMRKRMAKFITAEQDDNMVQKLLEWQKQHEQSVSGSPNVPPRLAVEKNDVVKLSTGGVTVSTSSEDLRWSSTREGRIATIDLVRKWGLKYDGGKDILKFVDRLEELAAMYEIDPSGIVPVMCEILKDRALIWFRNNHKTWESWAQFKNDFLGFFLPPRYMENLEAEIRARSQRSREHFKDYVLALQDLMYHSNLSKAEKLEIIFRNSAPDYQWYIRRRDFETLDDLLALAAELESIPTSRHTGRNEQHRMLKEKPGKSEVQNSSTTQLTWEEDKIKATVFLNQQLYTAMIDTGATRSFLSPTCLKQMRPLPRVDSTDIIVTLADGSKKQISSAVDIQVAIGNLSRSHTFLVMKEATEAVVLGLDFLRTFNTTIQCAGLNVKYPADRGEIRKDGLHHEVRGPTNIYFSHSSNPSTLAEDTTAPRRIKEFLEKELPKFKTIEGLCNVITHRIVMKDERPIKIRYAPRNPAMQAIIDEEVNSLLERGCIEPSRSPYSFPITLVKKKNGSWRTCMDFRQLNARSIPDAYPLPRIDTILDRLRNAKYISSLDLKDGYWQIPMESSSRKYTAFAVTGRGLYQWRVMPFGLHSAPATFQRALDTVIGPDMEPHAFAYLDDIIVIGRTLEEHMQNLKEVFRRLRAAKLKLNVEKCEFFKSETRYLGHMITGDGITTDPDKVAAIKQLPVPQDTKGIRQFLGITSWYRRFVPNFAKISQPLTRLLKKGKHWKWGQEQQEAFETLKDCLTKAPVLACPDFSKTFTLQTDASDCGLGAVLTQDVEGTERVIAYASRHLNGAEKNYSATEKECLAIVWGIRKMRPYLEGYTFRVITDHLSLKWLNSIDNPSGRLARWALELQQYRFTIDYRKGKQNIVADALSRNPTVMVNLVQAKPSTACPWYEKTMEEARKHSGKHPDYTVVNHQLYRHFAREVNDEDTTPWKLCVPTHQRPQVLAETHDQASGGHMGIRKTLNKLANRYYWPGMARDVSRYVRSCETCQRYKSSQQQPAGRMLIRIQEEPWSLVSADFIGPLPRTPHGNTTLLVLFDNFSKWVELIPSRKATAEGVVKALRERIVSRYGVPKVLVTDNGTQFTSRILIKYLEEIGIRQQFTAPYTPQENPTERANRTIKTTIAQFTKGRHNRWDELLPEIMLALNTSVSESTGYSPAFITQGRNPRLPRALYDEVTIGSGARCIDPEERASELKEIFKIVRRNQEKSSLKQRYHYDLRRRKWMPKIGDHVLVRQHPLSKAVDSFAAKLAPKFKGPYIITKFVSPVIVEIVEVETNHKRTSHLSDLKSYHTKSQSFSFISSRSSKPTKTKNSLNMDAEQHKFEKARDKFRQRMRQEQEKRPHTKFLADDEIPSTSRKSGKKTKATKRRRKGQDYQTRQPKDAKQPVLKTADEKPPTVRHFRMAATTPPCQHVGQPEVITVSEDEDSIPPPPPQLATSPQPCETGKVDAAEEEVRCGTPTWFLEDDESISLGDLYIDPEDLADPLVLEYYRTFLGKNDTTVAVRPPTPPSPFPPRSPSSIDWENENYRPPTPPRPRRYGSFEIQDRQYRHLGMHCYERVWRARILVPRKAWPPALCDTTTPTTRNWGPDLPAVPGSPPQQCHRPSPRYPPTPGRGWLHTTPLVSHSPPPSSRARSYSPVPPPPPLHNEYATIQKSPPLHNENSTTPPPPPLLLEYPASTPSPPLQVSSFDSSRPSQPVMSPEQTPLQQTSTIGPTKSVIDNPRVEQLPLEVQQLIHEKQVLNKGKRYRTLQKVGDCLYRITIKPNNEVQITLLERD